MTELTLFVSTFVLVFALGAQSLNVNNGHFLLAAVTSFVIGAGQMVLYKLAPNASWTEIAAYLMGGPFGITAVMRVHPYLVRWMKKNKPEPIGRDGPRPHIPASDFTKMEEISRRLTDAKLPHIPQPQPERSCKAYRRFED